MADQEEEARRQLKIKIVENFIPEQKQNLRDYIYIQKNKKPISEDKYHARSKYRKGTLVTYFDGYLVSIVKEYIESLNGVPVKKEQIGGWFQEFTKINDLAVFESIIQIDEVKKID